MRCLFPQHPNVIRVYGAETETERVGILHLLAMEPCIETGADGAVRSRTLSSVVLSDTDPLADEAKTKLLRQITSGLHYLHTNRDLAAHGLTHRDLKPDNVLVKRLVNGDNVAKLAGSCVNGSRAFQFTSVS